MKEGNLVTCEDFDHELNAIYRNTHPECGTFF